MTQTAFRLPADIIEGMERIRTRDGVGLSEQTRRALRDWLSKRGGITPTARKPRKK